MPRRVAGRGLNSIPSAPHEGAHYTPNTLSYFSDWPRPYRGV